MRVAVTGGTGFLGSRLVHSLLERGDEVTLLARASSKTGPQEAAGAKVIRLELLDQKGVSEALKGQDLLFHMAGTYEM